MNNQQLIAKAQKYLVHDLASGSTRDRLKLARADLANLRKQKAPVEVIKAYDMVVRQLYGKVSSSRSFRLTRSGRC